MTKRPRGIYIIAAVSIVCAFTISPLIEQLPLWKQVAIAGSSILIGCAVAFGIMFLISGLRRRG